MRATKLSNRRKTIASDGGGDNNEKMDNPRSMSMANSLNESINSSKNQI